MDKIIDLQLNYPLLDGQEALLKSALTQALSEIKETVSACKAGGDIEDKEIGAKWLSQPGYPIAFKNVFIGIGGHSSLLNVLLSVKFKNRVIAVDEFTYLNFKSIAKLMGLKIIPCSADGHGMTPAALAETCEIYGAEAVYLMPTISNPLGTVMPLARREEIVAIARKKDIVIIDDGAYSFLEDDIIPSFFHLAPERSFYIYSFSKPFAQGIKTSYLLAPDRYAENVIVSFKLTGSTATKLSVIALNKLIASGALQSVIQAKREEGNLRQRQATSLLGNFKVTGHKNGWHFWIALPPFIKSAALSDILISRGVGLVSSDKFAVNETDHAQGIRVALGGEPDFERVLKGIAIIAEELHKCGASQV